jgi:dTDP-4-dehydrorhamnose 3,5-epimerase
MTRASGWLKLAPTPLAGLVVIERQRRQDNRGYFSRFFCAEELALAGLETAIAQINHTFTSRRGSVRGLHFQYAPHGENKIVSCLRGEIFDVAVDLRRDSATFRKWYGEFLSADNRKSLCIPPGFAHGFQTLSDNCELIYLHSTPYVARSEGALNVNDPMLGIQWPLPFTDISERDESHAVIEADFTGI